uniref:DNA repair protein XRCC4 n=1 Tax=Oryza meridionalis TaxID=40149 RepID=A0A0E0D6P3_9ORYZ
MATSTAAPRHSCAKLSVAVEDPEAGGVGAVFVKATWHPTRFSLAVTDGAAAWVAQASDAEVRLRAEQWDQPVADYLALAERYLAFQQPSSTYSFHDAANGNRRYLTTGDLISISSFGLSLGSNFWLSWTFEKQGTKLEWRWKLQPAPNTQQTIAEILDFLMDANIRLSEEVVRKTQSFDKLKQESEKCLQQSERFSIEKADFEQSTFSKFVAVLNSKKAKLRQLKDKLTELESADKAPKEEDENSTDKTELFEEESDKDASVNDEPSETGGGDLHSSPEKTAATSRGGRGHKRTRK